jgi:hypothetical protein
MIVAPNEVLESPPPDVELGAARNHAAKLGNDLLDRLCIHGYHAISRLDS